MSEYTIANATNVLRLSEGAVRRAAEEHASLGALLKIVLRQAHYEARLRWRRHIRFRSRHNDQAVRAYAAMDPWEFEGVNARQAWANWRTIPRNLDRRAPSAPLRAVDLCCGTGQSTQVLAYYLAAGSEILGLEYNPRFVASARGRSYRTRDGGPAHVTFHAQSVLEPFTDPAGALLPDHSVDMVNSSGAVGCHFDPDTTAVLAAQVDRVLRPGGLAFIDSGRSGTPEPEVRAIFGARGFEVLNRARSCVLDRYRQICFRKRGETAS
ncbi:MAG TPA: methyltransferase domain-containing protein [Vicinamibacteria bacterium]